ncbi:UNVERIFIED_CONTAM: hypothetical protein PYX00_008866 [Menopon gallinae]|uniref:Uncharacterized protein n=1 Tax=Menopon gallinae TaxID=328185 RepID=A0AAW2H8W2_9NEOP
MRIICTISFIALNIFGFVNCKDEYVPVLVWTSPDISEEPTLALNKINRELFTSYLTMKLSKNKPLIAVFTEQNLGAEDLVQQNRNLHYGFPFLSNTRARITFFPSVERPYEAAKELVRHGYKWREMDSEGNMNEGDSSILSMVFDSVDEREREETLRKHDEFMAGVTERLGKSGVPWMCIYTGLHSGNVHRGNRPNTWRVVPEPVFPQKPLYLYKDEARGLALLTKGPIRLHLPTHGNHTVRMLEDYFAASFTRSEDAMDLFLWFRRYNLTFCMSVMKRDWFIESVNVQNENGQTMKLWPKSGPRSEKCCTKTNEFQSKGRPVVKVQLEKYKVVEINAKCDVCVNNVTLPFLCTIMFASVVFIVLVWSTILRTYRIHTSIRSNDISVPICLLSCKPVIHPEMKS